jgi:BarA-like signal transduction histidine kinase
VVAERDALTLRGARGDQATVNTAREPSDQFVPDPSISATREDRRQYVVATPRLARATSQQEDLTMKNRRLPTALAVAAALVIGMVITSPTANAASFGGSWSCFAPSQSFNWGAATQFSSAYATCTS